MDRLTIPDERIDEHTTRRALIDASAVREDAMKFYWRLKAYEDTGHTPEEVKALQEQAQRHNPNRIEISFGGYRKYTRRKG